MKPSAPATVSRADARTATAVTAAALPRVHGLRSCDSVKQALALFAGRQLPVEFHDFKRDGLPPALLDVWLRQLGPAGWSALLNRQGTTWRKLTTAQQAQAQTEPGARALMLDHPSLIKRPVVTWPRGELTVGLAALQAALQAALAML